MKIKRNTLKSIKNKITDLKIKISYDLLSNVIVYPKVVYLTINSVCNLKCKMCDFGQKVESQFYTNMNKPSELNSKQITRICSEVKSFNPIISIISTEPTLHPEFLNIIKIIKNNGLYCSITTNGFILKNFAESLVNLKLDEIWISLDGPSKIHNYQRGVEKSYENAIDGISKIISYKKKQNVDYPKININYTITPYNYNQIKLFVEELNVINEINSISFSHMNFITEDVAEVHNKLYSRVCLATPTCIKGIDFKDMNLDVFLDNINDVKKLRNVTFIPNLITISNLYDYYFTNKIISKKKCVVPWSVFQIQSNGDCIVMTRCFDLVMGNILNQSFKEIWFGKKYNFFRKELKRAKLFPACVRCCGVM